MNFLPTARYMALPKMCAQVHNAEMEVHKTALKNKELQRVRNRPVYMQLGFVAPIFGYLEA